MLLLSEIIALVDKIRVLALNPREYLSALVLSSRIRVFQSCELLIHEISLSNQLVSDHLYRAFMPSLLHFILLLRENRVLHELRLRKERVVQLLDFLCKDFLTHLSKLRGPFLVLFFL